ncbi:glycosyltransferase [Anaerovorax sp. IOR16]|uniref:glycosyltransferase n=1 Tax=Anaerovorax sp. IOR16 TaxID=2773458 RepID=UPI0019D2FBFE|nr:glycosyltransferase [Anaerovorax sp. IOR16]
MKHVVMILTNGYHPDVRVKKEAEYLESLGYRITILCWDRDNRFKDRATEDQGKIQIVRFFPYAQYGSGACKQFKSYLQFLKECREYLIEINFDFLHCHDLDGAIIGYLCGKRDIPVIFDMHEYYVNAHNFLKKWMQAALVQYCQRRASWIIYLNQRQKRDIIKKNRNKLVFLPNYSKKIRNQNKVFCETIRIAYIGEVRCKTEMENLISAAAKVGGIQVNIHGGGVCYQELAEKYEAWPDVYFTGRFLPEQVEELYANTDYIYAIYDKIQNHTTGYPVKFYEGLNSVTPVIAGKGTSMGAFVEENSVGFTVDGSSGKDVEALLQKLRGCRDLVENCRRNIREQGLDRQFLWDDIVKNLDKIYGGV